MTRKGRPLSYYNAHPRAFDQAVEDWNERELARYERQVDLADAEVDPDYEAWVASIEPDEAA